MAVGFQCERIEEDKIGRERRGKMRMGDDGEDSIDGSNGLIGIMRLMGRNTYKFIVNLTMV